MLKAVNSYYFRARDLERVCDCMKRKRLDELHTFCLLEVKDDGTVLSGEFKDSYRSSGKSYMDFLSGVLEGEDDESS